MSDCRGRGFKDMKFQKITYPTYFSICQLRAPLLQVRSLDEEDHVQVTSPSYLVGPLDEVKSGTMHKATDEMMKHFVGETLILTN